jgi:predicted transposase YdaD
MEPHDHNFKNLFLDFPKEALAWLLPEALQEYGKLLRLEFVRQEPRKRKLSDSHLSLDMPILFTFESGKILMWLVEFQEDKQKFSIYRLLRYTTSLMESHREATVVPVVLFTKRAKWKKDIARSITSRLGEREFLHFEYQLIRLFDFKASDYYDYPNPVVKILLPKMNYTPSQRGEVIRRAYQGLFELVTPMLFDKYVDFIDVYAQVKEEEKESLYNEIFEQEDTAMLAQYIREKGFKEGLVKGELQGKLQGKLEGKLEGKIEGKCALLERQLTRRFGPLPAWAKEQLASATDAQLDSWGERVLDAQTIREVLAQ